MGLHESALAWAQTIFPAGSEATVTAVEMEGDTAHVDLIVRLPVNSKEISINIVKADVMTMLYHCARCGEDHEVSFKPLTRPIEDSDGTLWTHWAPCPVNGEPILMKQSESHEVPGVRA